MSPSFARPPMQPGEWSRNILGLPVHTSSAAWLSSIGTANPIWPAFGTLYAGQPNGFLVAYIYGPAVPRSGVSFLYASESDLVSGPTPPAGSGYLLPLDVPVESGNQDSLGDRHVLVVDTASCKLYELFKTSIKVWIALYDDESFATLSCPHLLRCPLTSSEFCRGGCVP
jgi:hypothetical protein